MDSIEVRRPITVKVIMTEDFRKQIVSEANQTIERLETNLKLLEDQITEQITTLEDKDPSKVENLRQQIEFDQERLQAMKAELTWKIHELENTKEGTEFPFQIIEGSVPVKVGDNLLEKMTRCEIVIKDWKVMEVRNP